MRKYDSKNKRNIGIIIAFAVVFAIIFSYFLYRQINLSKIQYKIENGSIVFDYDKNNILLESDGVIKKKWNKNYYLIYDDEQTKIGENVISYNNNSNSLSLYGTFYQVDSKNEVELTEEETKLNNLGISRFYKIADRKYLLVDSSIKSDDGSLETSNYLIVELDKLGNAILYNNNLNLKTFSETKLVTSSYTFDIANELLIYDNNTIDLKKILGTTNEYQKKDDNTTDNDNSNGSGGNGNDTTTTDNQTTTNNNTNTEVVTNEQGTSISETEIINQTSVTSIIKITPSISNINVDYVVYDAKGDYLSVFVEVSSDLGSNTLYLSKSSTNISIDNLIPGVDYTLTFKYRHMDNDTIKEETIGTYTATTLLPDINLDISKVTNSSITYKVSISNYIVTSAKVRLYIDNVKQTREISLSSSNINSNNVFSLNGITIPNNSIVTLSLEDIYINGNYIDKTVTSSYRKSVANTGGE